MFLLSRLVFGSSRDVDVCVCLYHWLTDDSEMLFFDVLITEYVKTLFRF